MTMTELRKQIRAAGQALDLAEAAALETAESAAKWQLEEALPTIGARGDYSERTGHRLIVDYRNEQGRRTVARPVVVLDTERPGTWLVLDVSRPREPRIRSFKVERIERALLDGVEVAS